LTLLEGREAMSIRTIAAALLLAAAPAAAQTVPANIAAAAADPARAEQAKDDARRHGPEILAFAGVPVGGTVIEIAPGGGYWTRLLSKAVGPKGHVYVVWPKPLADEEQRDVAAFQTMIKQPEWANVSLEIAPPTSVPAATKADLIFTSQNYHDYLDKFMGPSDPAVFNKAMLGALKPGGIYLVIDHTGLPGSGTDATEKLHRIDPALVKSQVTAAGFEFVGESKLLANPDDPKNNLVFAPAIRGKTDQFIYKFRRPK
jgi:predicted methyltransferase